MTARGWVVGHVTEPAGFHHMLNPTNEPVVDRYLDDLGACLAETPPPQRGATVTARY